MIKSLHNEGGGQSLLESRDGSVYFYTLLGLWFPTQEVKSAWGELGMFLGLAGRSGRWVPCFAELEAAITTSASCTRHEKTLLIKSQRWGVPCYISEAFTDWNWKQKMKECWLGTCCKFTPSFNACGRYIEREITGVQLWRGKELEMPWETELCSFLLAVTQGSSEQANL